MNTVSYRQDLVSTNPCGEVFMPPYDCCCLGAINLHTHIIDGKIDFDLLEETVATSVRFLDNVLDQNNYPMPIIKDTCQKYRRIGLGVMGLHDMLLEVGFKYSSEEARNFVDQVMDCIKKQAYHTSIRIAIEKGSFHALDVDQHTKTGFAKKCLTRNHRRLIKEHGIRNCALLCIAPTGTTSIVAGCSSGIEPLFQPVYERRFNIHKDTHDEKQKSSALGNTTEIIVHPLLKKFLKASRPTKHFQGAHDISPDDHLAMQAVCQRHIDNSISKTINLPSDYNVERLSKDMRKFIDELKGITVYRDGSRGESPMKSLLVSDAKKHLDRLTEEAAVNDCPSGKCDITKGGS
jgi:ribonucleoside-diphosphate reductase alpha chain